MIEPIRISALNVAGVGVTGATILLSIRRTSDGQWWNGAAFQAGYTTVSMTEVDATNWPGEYQYDFNLTGLAGTTYQMRATTATAGVANDPWAGEFQGIVETEGSYTWREVLSVLLSACAGRTTDSGLTFKTPNNNATRIAATVNSSDERTAITLTPST